MNLNEKSFNELVAGYNELIAKSYEYLKAIHLKREQEVKDAVSAYKKAMANLGFSEEEMRSILEEEASINPLVSQVALPEAEENNGEEALALPEHQEESKVETKTTSVFDLPALKEPYNPQETKKSVTPTASQNTPVEGTEETLPTMESLLSDDPEYKAFYHPVTLEKKNNRRLPTFDELLSGEPVNKILCLGNEEPKGKAYRQHTRINHVGGIIPTETATGKTGIYIPAS